MTPKPESETDPWATVKRFHVQPRPDDARLVHHVEAGEGQPAGFYMWAQDVDAARAAVERQHAAALQTEQEARVAAEQQAFMLATRIEQERTSHAAALAEKDKEIADLKRRRVTKREQREWDDIQGEALTLRSYIREHGETPMMTASRAERAEADLATLRAQVETLTAELRDERGRHGETLVSAEANTSELHRRITALTASLAAVEAERDRLKAALEQAREWMRVASRTLRASGGRPSRDVALTTADQIDAALSGEGTKP